MVLMVTLKLRRMLRKSRNSISITDCSSLQSFLNAQKWGKIKFGSVKGSRDKAIETTGSKYKVYSLARFKFNHSCG